MNERLFVRLEDDPLYAPETSVPAGALHEFAVAADLADCVAHVVAYEEALPDGVTATERVLPDGALRLIFELGDGGDSTREGGRARVAGPSTTPVVLRMSGRMHGLSVTLRPGAAPALFGAAAGELAERVVPWETLAGAPQRTLIERLQSARDDGARADVLMRVLRSMRRHTGDRGESDEVRRTRRAAALLGRGDGVRTVAAVAGALGLGERRLQQLFDRQLGLSPRRWARLSRLHHCLRLLREQAASPRWSELALEGGYCDQSHLINEFRALCGLTPEQFLRRHGAASPVSGSSKTAPRDGG